jgi:hypothetical protein
MREGFGSFDDLIAAIGARYGADEANRVTGEMDALALKDVKALEIGGRQIKPEYLVKIAKDNLARYALIVSPDAEFLNGIEIALDMVGDSYAEAGTANGSQVRNELGAHIDALFSKRSVPYRYDFATGKIVWEGDSAIHIAVIRPALQVLNDGRLAGARSEFEAAQGHLRVGTQKDLEDAIDEAAKSVESTMKVLVSETNTAPPNTATATPLFNALRDAGQLPAHADHLVLAAARIRNQRGGHGAGAQPRQIEPAEAIATVNAAATAIAFLAARLP